MHENVRIYVQISGHNSNFRTFQDKFQNFRNFRTTPRPVDGAKITRRPQWQQLPNAKRNSSVTAAITIIYLPSSTPRNIKVLKANKII